MKNQKTTSKKPPTSKPAIHVNIIPPKQSAMMIENITIIRKNKIQFIDEEYTKEVNAIRDKCNHEWVYYPDPSGNNDSAYICACGAESRKRPTVGHIKP